MEREDPIDKIMSEWRADKLDAAASDDFVKWLLAEIGGDPDLKSVRQSKHFPAVLELLFDIEPSLLFAYAMLLPGSNRATKEDKAMYPTIDYSPRLLRCATRDQFRTLKDAYSNEIAKATYEVKVLGWFPFLPNPPKDKCWTVTKKFLDKVRERLARSPCASEFAKTKLLKLVQGSHGTRQARGATRDSEFLEAAELCTSKGKPMSVGMSSVLERSDWWLRNRIERDKLAYTRTWIGNSTKDSDWDTSNDFDLARALSALQTIPVQSFTLKGIREQRKGHLDGIMVAWNSLVNERVVRFDEDTDKYENRFQWAPYSYIVLWLAFEKRRHDLRGSDTLSDEEWKVLTDLMDFLVPRDKPRRISEFTAELFTEIFARYYSRPEQGREYVAIEYPELLRHYDQLLEYERELVQRKDYDTEIDTDNSDLSSVCDEFYDLDFYT